MTIKLTWNDIAHIQTELDQAYVRALKSYEQALESGVPEWLLKKPERIILMNQPFVFRAPHGANIKPHYGVKS